VQCWFSARAFECLDPTPALRFCLVTNLLQEPSYLSVGYGFLWAGRILRSGISVEWRMSFLGQTLSLNRVI
jgi:hypothetical protein